MTKPTFDTLFFRTDAVRNMYRFYRIDIQPNLLGGYSLIRNWGRIGSSSQTKIKLLESETTAHQQAIDHLMRKKKRGYKISASETQTRL